MAKVLTFSRKFPKYHPRFGQETYFVAKIKTFQKMSTIRKGYHFKGETEASLRYWIDKPYYSKQEIILARENIITYPIEIHNYYSEKKKKSEIIIFINKNMLTDKQEKVLAFMEGFDCFEDFIAWFNLKENNVFEGTFILLGDYGKFYFDSHFIF